MRNQVSAVSHPTDNELQTLRALHTSARLLLCPVLQPAQSGHATLAFLVFLPQAPLHEGSPRPAVLCASSAPRCLPALSDLGFTVL